MEIVTIGEIQVIEYLKIFTFLSLAEIKGLETKMRESPEKRTAQKKLASELTALVHGKTAAIEAKNVSKALFSQDFLQLTREEVLMGFKQAPSHKINSIDKSLMETLVELDIISSKRQAREDFQNGAIYINGSRCQDAAKKIKDLEALHQEFLILRRGKKNYHLLKLIKS